MTAVMFVAMVFCLPISYIMERFSNKKQGKGDAGDPSDHEEPLLGEVGRIPKPQANMPEIETPNQAIAPFLSPALNQC
jgi:hypothetical protein